DASAAARGLEGLSSAARAADDLPGLTALPRVELSTADTNAIADYSGAAYVRLNQALRSGDSAAMTGSLGDLSDNLSSALSKLPDYQGVAYRGTTLDEATVAKYAPGQTVTEPAFTSSSTDSPFPGNTQFTIFSASGKDISGLSSIPNENEVLFDKGSQFKVISNDYLNGVHVVVMKEVPR
ncbi:MAG: ADP-ribosyltransferase, partial [Jatrophihabitantaceae bacterium]